MLGFIAELSEVADGMRQAIDTGSVLAGTDVNRILMGRPTISFLVVSWQRKSCVTAECPDSTLAIIELLAKLADELQLDETVGSPRRIAEQRPRPLVGIWS